MVVHSAPQRVGGSRPVDFTLGRAAVLVHIPCVANDVLQGEDGNAVHGIVDAGLPSFVDFRVSPMPLDGHSAKHGFALFPVVVPENVADGLGVLAQGVLHALACFQVGLNSSQRVHAQAVHHLLQGVVAELIPHLVLLHRLQGLALVGQIGRPHRVRGGQLFRQFRRVPGAGVVDAHRAQGGAVSEDAPGHGGVPGQPVQLMLQLGRLFAVHGVIYPWGRRRPGVAAVHLVGAGKLRVDGVLAEHEGDGAVLGVPIPGFHDGDRGHGQATQLEGCQDAVLVLIVKGQQLVGLLHRGFEGEFRLLLVVGLEALVQLAQFLGVGVEVAERLMQHLVQAVHFPGTDVAVQRRVQFVIYLEPVRFT